jgi:hypothetical protein
MKVNVQFLALLILWGSACKNKDMQFTQQGILGSVSAFEDTTPEGHQIFAVVGDSNADGRGTTIPTVASGVLYNWDGSTFNEITTQSVSNDDNTKGSIWQQFATVYNGDTGYKVNLVNGASGGAEFYPNGDNNNWYTSGTLYAAWKTKMDDALAFRGLSTPKGIFVNLGINDCRSANTITDIETGIDSFFSRVMADYPGVPIILIIPGRSETTTFNDLKYYQVRHYLREKAVDNADVYVIANACSFIGITGGYEADNLHYSQDTNTILGNVCGYFYRNEDIANKWARAVVGFQYNTLTANQRTLITDFVTNQYNDGNYLLLEALYKFRTGDARDVLVDWTFLGYGFNNGATFTANSNIRTQGGTNFWWSASYTPGVYQRSGAGQNDVIAGVKLETRNTASGTAGVMFGRTDAGGDAFRIAQSTTFANYYVNNQTQENYTDVALAASTLHSIARNGTDMSYAKNGSVVETVTLASTGAVDQALMLGKNLVNTTSSFAFDGTFTYMYAGKYVGFDLSTFYTDMEYVIAHWND